MFPMNHGSNSNEKSAFLQETSKTSVDFGQCYCDLMGFPTHFSPTNFLDGSCPFLCCLLWFPPAFWVVRTSFIPLWTYCLPCHWYCIFLIILEKKLAFISNGCVTSCTSPRWTLLCSLVFLNSLGELNQVFGNRRSDFNKSALQTVKMIVFVLDEQYEFHLGCRFNEILIDV